MDGFNEFLAWCVAMYESDEDSESNRLTLYNWYFDVHYGHIDKIVARDIAKAIAEKWTASDEDEREEFPINIYNAVIKARYADEEELFCKGAHHGEIVKPYPSQCTRIMNFRVFAKHHLDLKKVRRDGFKTQLTPKNAQQMSDTLQNPDKRKTWFRKGSKMQNDKGFAWVTLTEDIEAVKSTTTPARYALEIIRALGLDFDKRGIPIIQVDYPADTLKKDKFAPPTALEGTPSFIYRSCIRGDGYGRTVHKESLEDGVRELVHLALDLTPDFRVMYVGRAGEHDFKWETFYNHYCDVSTHPKHSPICDCGDTLPQALAELIYRQTP